MSKEGSVPRAALPAWLAPIVVILGWMGMGIAAGTLFRHLGLRPALLVSEALLPLPALLALALSRVPIAEGLALRRLDARATRLALGAGVAFWGVSYGLLELQYVFWRPPSGYLEAFRRLHDALRPSGPFDAVASVATIALAPALFEEILFRGIVLPSLLRSVGTYGAIAVSALLFGIIHLDFLTPGATFYRVPFAFVVGLGLGLLRIRSGSLLPPFLAHALLNTITFVAALLIEEPAGGLPEPQPLLGTAFLALGLAASAWMMRRIDSPARSS
jgi:membrane protease YdiL (CAAX protease family)